jgi:hypothetical protein
MKQLNDRKMFIGGRFMVEYIRLLACECLLAQFGSIWCGYDLGKRIYYLTVLLKSNIIYSASVCTNFNVCTLHAYLHLLVLWNIVILENILVPKMGLYVLTIDEFFAEKLFGDTSLFRQTSDKFIL